MKYCRYFFLFITASLFWLTLSQAQNIDLQKIIGEQGNTDDFLRATEAREFSFPKDHGKHPDYKTEWWYFTGNLRTANGRKFGYQLTLFRNGLYRHRLAIKSPSKWRSKDIYLGHFALSDIQSGQFYAFERFSRDALGLAGASLATKEKPFRIWLQDWHISALAPSSNDIFPLQLQARAGDIAITLRLQPTKPLVLQGNRGLSQKSAQVGNASYYYSLTRLSSRGHIDLAEQRYTVQGNSWFDREWSTSSLSQQQSGWDWFALQLDSGEELMFYQLRNKNGQADPHSKGIWVDADGQSQLIEATDITLQVLDYWQSPTTHIRYPAHWQISLPKKQLTLTISPLLANQEWHTAIRYWEGAIRISGQQAGKSRQGYGYMELTGYE